MLSLPGKQMFPRTTHIVLHKFKRADRSRLQEQVRLSGKNYEILPFFRCLEFKKQRMEPDLEETHKI